MALIADLAVPESPTGILTVVCPHLEDYAPPSGRRRQMDFLLQAIRSDGNPLVMAGDLNTTGHNGTPVTIKRAILKYVTDYRFWLRQAFYFFVPAPGLGYVVRGAKYFKNFHDPTAINIPIFAANHEKHLFNDARVSVSMMAPLFPSTNRPNEVSITKGERSRIAINGRGKVLQQHSRLLAPITVWLASTKSIGSL